MFALVLLCAAAFAAGIINTLAGGGSFLTFPALLMAGLDPRAANITSTIALFPMQVSTGFAGRQHAGGTRHLSFKALLIISLIGGAIGAALLLMTSSTAFEQLVPWLLLFATLVFAWGNFFKRPVSHKKKVDRTGRIGTGIIQFLISIYGGYFGAGIGLMMLAAFSYAGMPIRQSTTTKNILAAVMNTAAVAVFVFSPDVHWFRAGLVAIFSVAGGLIGVRMLHTVNETYLKIFVLVIGAVLTGAMFWRAS